MLSLEAAQQRILAALPPPLAESLPLTAATGRLLAETITSPLDLPPFDNSAMDGYAVRAEDVAGAAATQPRALRLIGHVAAGVWFTGEVTAGTCVRIFTGSPLPRGADAVVMQEDTRTDATTPEFITFLDAAKPWENVRLRGEDVKQGAIIGAAGTRLTANRVGLLAAVGGGTVRVGRAPVTGLLATGSELREAGQPLAPGQIYESNRATLAPLLRQAGAVPRVYPLVPDTLADTRAALERAFAECDVVVTSGGASVGEFDFVKHAFGELGGELEFWQVAMKPGKPFVFGRWRGKFLFGLPGNPVSAFATFLLLVRPALLRWQGAASVNLPAHPAVLAEPFVNRASRRCFFRVRVDAAGRVRTAGMQASHCLASLAEANALLDVPPGTTLLPQTPVQVLTWGDGGE